MPAQVATTVRDDGVFWTDGGLIPGDLERLCADFAADFSATELPAAELAAEPGRPPALVILCGLPGTGKSHFARALVKQAPLAWVNSDYCRKRLIGRPDYSREEHQRVFAAMHALIAELLAAGRPVVFDATNLNEEVRRPLYAVADAAGVTPLLIRFTARAALVRRRMSERAAGQSEASHSDAGWEVYARMADADGPAPRPHLLVSRPEHLDWALRETLRRTGLGPV